MKVNLPYMTRSGRPSVGRFVGRSVIISKKGGQFHSHVPIVAEHFFCNFPNLM